MTAAAQKETLVAANVQLNIEDHVAHVELNRPDKYNAISLSLFHELAQVGDRIATDSGVRAVVLSGAGENFCAGIDVSVFGPAGAGDVREALQPRPSSPANLFQRAAFVWREVPVPVICAIHGVAFGAGLQIALGADIRYAAPDARLSVMEIRWGLIPDIAISVLARDVARSDVLRELAFTGREVRGDEAVALGLVTSVHDEPLAAALQTARDIAGRSPDAIRATKRLFNEGWQLGQRESLQLEAKLQAGLIGGDNQLEAAQANIERREPQFTD